jgi:hypothetical protein
VDPTTGEVDGEVDLPRIIAPGGRAPLQGFCDVSARGAGIAADGELIWVAEEPDIVAIDPASLEIRERMTVASCVETIDAEDGEVLVGTMAEGQGHFAVVDPPSKEFLDSGAAPSAFPEVLIADGWWWTGSRTRDESALSRTSTDGRVHQEIGGIRQVDAMVAAGGLVWIADGDTLLRIDVPEDAGGNGDGPIEAVSLSLKLQGPVTIASGGDRLWLLEAHGTTSRLYPLDPIHGRPAGEAVELPYGFPAEMTVDEAGVPWIAFRDAGVIVSPGSAVSG